MINTPANLQHDSGTKSIKKGLQINKTFNINSIFFKIKEILASELKEEDHETKARFY